VQRRFVGGLTITILARAGETPLWRVATAVLLPSVKRGPFSRGLNATTPRPSVSLGTTSERKEEVEREERRGRKSRKKKRR